MRLKLKGGITKKKMQSKFDIPKQKLIANKMGHMDYYVYTSQIMYNKLITKNTPKTGYNMYCALTKQIFWVQLIRTKEKSKACNQSQ